MDPSDSDSLMERGRGRAFPQQTSALKSVGNALQRSSSGYGTGEKSQSFGTASIVRIFILLNILYIYWLMMIFLLTFIIPNSLQFASECSQFREWIRRGTRIGGSTM